MRATLIGSYFKHITDAWLTARVHWDAFCTQPHAYLTATKWWIKRRRVRARGQFALLLGQSPRAYALWAVRNDQRIRAPSPIDTERPVIVLVDMMEDHCPSDLTVTRRSVESERLIMMLIGSSRTPTLKDAISQIDWEKEPWFMILTPGDRIEPGAISVYRKDMDDPLRHVLYADDDLLIGRRRSGPNFKPDWNAELFRHSDYLSGACMVRPTHSDFEAVASAADWATQLVSKMAGKGEPLHIREMLHHRRRRPAPSLPARPLSILANLPLVSVIIPTRNHVDLLRTCLDGVATATYPNIEIIVVDNDSDDRETLAYLAGLDPARHHVLPFKGAFNYSAINNAAVAHARGELLCLLNNDVEMIKPDWLDIMATQAMRPEVGAVGARLLYPDGRIQHAGVVIGVGNAAGHAHRFLRPEEEGYFHRHSLPQFTMAVTAACLMVKREKFLAVGGLDEQNFPVAFNDVDLCLRLNQQGWQSLYEPRATLIHHESVSRGFDKDPVGAARFAGELAALQRLWQTDRIIDPYHHPYLSRSSEQFAVAL